MNESPLSHETVLPFMAAHKAELEQCLQTHDQSTILGLVNFVQSKALQVFRDSVAAPRAANLTVMVQVVDTIWAEFHYPAIKNYQQQHGHLAALCRDESKDRRRRTKNGKAGGDLRKLNEQYTRFSTAVYRFYHQVFAAIEERNGQKTDTLQDKLNHLFQSTLFSSDRFKDNEVSGQTSVERNGKGLYEFNKDLFELSGNKARNGNLKPSSLDISQLLCYVSYRCLLSMGDVARYSTTTQINYLGRAEARDPNVSYERASANYIKAMLLVPEQGDAYNYQGMVNNLLLRDLDALFWFARAGSVRVVSSLGWHNFTNLLAKLQPDVLGALLHSRIRRARSPGFRADMAYLCVVGYYASPLLAAQGKDVWHQNDASRLVNGTRVADIEQAVCLGVSNVEDVTVVKEILLLIMVHARLDVDARDALFAFVARYVCNILDILLAAKTEDEPVTLCATNLLAVIVFLLWVCHPGSALLGGVKSDSQVCVRLAEFLNLIDEEDEEPEATLLDGGTEKVLYAGLPFSTEAQIDIHGNIVALFRTFAGQVLTGNSAGIRYNAALGMYVFEAKQVAPKVVKAGGSEKAEAVNENTMDGPKSFKADMNGSDSSANITSSMKKLAIGTWKNAGGDSQLRPASRADQKVFTLEALEAGISRESSGEGLNHIVASLLKGGSVSPPVQASRSIWEHQPKASSSYRGQSQFYSQGCLTGQNQPMAQSVGQNSGHSSMGQPMAQSHQMPQPLTQPSILPQPHHLAPQMPQAPLGTQPQSIYPGMSQPFPYSPYATPQQLPQGYGYGMPLPQQNFQQFSPFGNQYQPLYSAFPQTNAYLQPNANYSMPSNGQPLAREKLQPWNPAPYQSHQW
ncbi:hypothetical protein BABINDRAFT_161149 [Babjeviella inositovora NRRL Y-12698]|uniref:DNA/RNA-binding domain-containing protein n=1 Tax=Babjeviella inositovora NRRL Y-12698 TaxID=984486 RepID=A0A1E3QR97_9ASCO|nr:uncharacterized protein BABINDRAFT_161149 [Babjeviella inositovora NRRL Y-12698]ODQ80170.1 hypothetical protein BABINDRAFT_161149 [Babjeviella inositovora NRRL Y-12698]